MLYCFSQAAYSDDELTGYFATMTKNDAVVLWQDGVLLAIKYPHYFKECKASCFVLEQDISARNLTALFSFAANFSASARLKFNQKILPRRPSL